jgi:hypothetical protein
MYTEKILPEDTASLDRLGKHAPFFATTKAFIIVLKIVTVSLAAYSFASLIGKVFEVEAFSLAYYGILGVSAALVLFLSNFYTANIKMATNQLYDKIDNSLQTPYLYAIIAAVCLGLMVGLDYYASYSVYTKHLDDKFVVYKDSSNLLTKAIILKELTIKEQMVKNAIERNDNAKNEILKRNGTEAYKLKIIKKAERNLEGKINKTAEQSNKTILAISKGQAIQDSITNATNAETVKKRNEQERNGTRYLFLLNLLLNLILGFIVCNTVRIETLCGISYRTRIDNDKNVFSQSLFVLNAIFVKNTNNLMGWLYNKLTPNKTIQLKDFKQDKANAFVNQVIQRAKETPPDAAPETKTETEKPETETKETLNANRFTVPSVPTVYEIRKPETKEEGRRTIGYNIPNTPTDTVTKQTFNTVTVRPNVTNVIERNDIRVIKEDRIKNCLHCHQHFTAQTNRAKYCSDKCRIAFFKAKKND